jgi:hypothetical protein
MTAKVLYIAGAHRTGSTLICRALGLLSDGFAGAEISVAWQAFLEDRICGCGRPFSACPVWAEVVATSAEVFQPGAAATYLRYQQHWITTPRVATLLTLPTSRLFDRAVPTGYPEALGSLYRAIGNVTHGTLIIDSSKSPAYLLHLSRLPEVDVRVVHIVRDPRAVVFSYQRHKTAWTSKSGVEMPMMRRRPLSTGMRWTAWNLLTDRLVRRLALPSVTLRYEDAMVAPAALTDALTRLDIPSREVPAGGEFSFGVDHTIQGNPQRFSIGTVRLRKDDEWTTRASPLSTTAATLSTLPLLRRYGYPLFPRQ